MFEKRLTWFWILLTVVALAIIGRLVQIQLADAAQYDELAERILTRRPIYIPAPRGTIHDRHGTPLLSDEPTFDVGLRYALVSDDEPFLDNYLIDAARDLRKRGDFSADTKLADISTELKQIDIPYMWQRLSTLTGVSADELRERAAELRRSVQRILAKVQRESPKVREIAEQHHFLPVAQDVHNDVALAVRLELEYYPWLRVVPASRRVAHHADALVHVLGRLGAASAARITDDPLRGAELRELHPTDRCGISGVERLAETSLRGRRGRIIESYDRAVLQRTDPAPGQDVYLTIDVDLQQHVLKLLDEAVSERVHQAGAAAVVIDVATREIRALASYPTYSYDRFSDDYDQLRRDARRLPLRFRAVAEQYPPGSICKAITLIGGLTEGVVTAHTRIHCTGALRPEKPTRFRCWIYNLHPGLTHDMTDDPNGQDASSAVRNSCNIYFYTVGGKLGPERLAQWFSRFGLGRLHGTGLIEESPGIAPDEEWMQTHANRRHRAADAWNFAIGQGEVTCTPLQAANVAATIAAGYWAPVRLAYDDTGLAFGAPPAPVEPFNEQHLRVLREGMWRVVNERGGTAQKHAKLDHDHYEFCGKTGSAQTTPRPLSYRYTFEWPDGRREERIAYLEDEALATFGDEKPRRVGKHVATGYPALAEDEKLPTHAWFIGFTQPKTTPRGQAPTGNVYAISVVIEFGGGGGSVAGPVARQIAEYLLGGDSKPQ